MLNYKLKKKGGQANFQLSDGLAGLGRSTDGHLVYEKSKTVRHVHSNKTTVIIAKRHVTLVPVKIDLSQDPPPSKQNDSETTYYFTYAATFCLSGQLLHCLSVQRGTSLNKWGYRTQENGWRQPVLLGYHRRMQLILLFSVILAVCSAKQTSVHVLFGNHLVSCTGPIPAQPAVWGAI